MSFCEPPSVFPVNTRRYLDVVSTFYERYERQMDVKIMLYAHWVVSILSI